MTVQIRRITPPEFSILAPQLVDIYIQAMEYSPAIAQGRASSWRAETYYPGFSAVIAEDHTGLVGVAYGFLGNPDAWWDRQLRRAFVMQGGPDEQQQALLRSYFEVAEIHVRPGAQGHGIGKRMLTELLWNVPADYALLSTPEVPGELNGAFGLYRSFGFFDVLRDHHYPGDARPFAVLGLKLPIAKK